MRVQWGNILTNAYLFHAASPPSIRVPQRSELLRHVKRKQAVMELGRHYHPQYFSLSVSLLHPPHLTPAFHLHLSIPLFSLSLVLSYPLF